MRLRLPLARIVTVLLFAALCAIVAAWALALLAPRPPVAPAGAVAESQGPADLSAAGQLFGGAPQAVAIDAAPAVPSNIQVAGVLATTGRGVALLAVDGRPAKPFAVGETVADGLRVRAVTGDAVELERSGAGAPLRLPAPPRGSVAVLSSGPQRGGAAGGATLPPVAPIAPPPGGAAPSGLPPVVQRALPPAGADAAASVPAAQAVAPGGPPMDAGAMPGAGAPMPRVPSLGPGLPPPGTQ